MQFVFPSDVKSDFNGYRTFIMLHHSIKDEVFGNIVLDFSSTKWFDANLCAVLGAVLTKATDNLNTISFEGMNDSLTNLLRRNHFLSHFGGVQLPDDRFSSVEYRKFKTTDEKVFKTYLDNDLLSMRSMPEMSKELQKRINESLFEVFSNAVIHGQCKSIFSCGQYFPFNKSLNFTIVDLGRTIKKNVNEYLKETRSASDSILWAIEEGHTTKIGNIPGGLGLSFTRRFIEVNKGKLQIISSKGFWQESEKSNFAKEFEQYFPGTIVTFEFKTDDGFIYSLTDESNEKLIF